jgi:hypothetical protein
MRAWILGIASAFGISTATVVVVHPSVVTTVQDRIQSVTGGGTSGTPSIGSCHAH